MIERVFDIKHRSLEEKFSTQRMCEGIRVICVIERVFDIKHRSLEEKFFTQRINVKVLE